MGSPGRHRLERCGGVLMASIACLQVQCPTCVSAPIVAGVEPQLGDVTVCPRCFALRIWTERGARALTEAEASHPDVAEVRRLLVRTVRRIGGRRVRQSHP